jgi:hypothetical protein
MEATEVIQRPWYREFWVWFFLCILGMGVASGTGVLVIGINNAPQMVTGDYQPLGKVLVNTGERSDRALALGLSGALSVTGQEAEIQLAADEAGTLPDQLLLRFQHPTDAARDISALAERVAPGRWAARLGEQRLPTRARVIVSDLSQEWWLAARFEGAVEGRLELNAEPL